MMNRIFLLALGACALAGNAMANVDELYAIGSGKCWAAAKFDIETKYYGPIDPEHIRDADNTLRDMQSEAVVRGAQTPEEIDRYVYIAWHEMYLKLKALVSVEGHKPAQ